MKTKAIRCRIIYLPDSKQYYAQIKGWFFWHRFCLESLSVGGGNFINVTKFFSSIEEAKACIKNYYERTYAKKSVSVVQPLTIYLNENGSVSVVEE
jgi:hypothetical protein